MPDRNLRHEQRVREIIKDGLAGCPPMELGVIRELAQLAGKRHGITPHRVDELLEEEYRQR